MRSDLKSVPKSAPKVRGASMSGNGVVPVAVRPLHDRVIVKRVAQDETSKGGIIIPDNAKEKPQEGQVVAVGPGRRNDNGKIVALGVEKGDRVLFAKFAGRDVEIHGEEHLILEESDILGVIEK